MNNHEAVKHMAQAWKHIRAATELVTCPRALDQLEQADALVYKVGEGKFGEEFGEEVKRKYSDN